MLPARAARRLHFVAALFASVGACAVAGCVADDTAAEPSLGAPSGYGSPESSGSPDATIPDASLDARADGALDAASDASSDADAQREAGEGDGETDAGDGRAGDAEPVQDASDAGDG
ncbi:MAG TPA: hypothetical protein VGI39_06920 [Polyangiaceae bacterium]